jgi:addiction module HigA family antidote
MPTALTTLAFDARCSPGNVGAGASRPWGAREKGRLKNVMRPAHPGEVLREDYLKPMGLIADALARQLQVPASCINDIVLERRGITADTALRLSHFFGGDAQSWLNLQTAYDLRPAALNEVLQAFVRQVHPMRLHPD